MSQLRLDETAAFCQHVFAFDISQWNIKTASVLLYAWEAIG